jgi:hypothetical protein
MNIHPESYQQVLDEVLDELLRARAIHPPFRSLHEAYAVILEELDEVWAEIKAKKPDYDKLRVEGIQLCAMTLRFVTELKRSVE